jgi:hypothetical protein
MYTLQLMCKSAKIVGRMNSVEDAETLVDVYRTALTTEIMDAKQSEYYTDYSIYGMSDATKEDKEQNIQPNPLDTRDADAVAQSEMWFYEEIPKGTENYFKFRMRPTDDQKQVVTGGDMLYNRLIADDCETSASFIIGEHKSFMGIRAYMVHNALWDDTVLDHTAFFERAIPNIVVQTLTGWTKTSSTGQNAPWSSKFIPQYAGENPLFSSYDEAYDTVKALANILRQYHLHAELCIGSASAAAIGEEEKPLGHCFAMLKATHVQEQHIPMDFILEGTNWIAQKSIMGIHGSVNDKIYGQITEIATIMMEATKLALGADIDKDHGKALSMVKERCATAFWRSIYAKGSALMTYKDPTDGCFVYGVRAFDVIRSNDNIKAITLDYSLVCMKLLEQGITIHPGRLRHVIHSVGEAEAVPQWSKLQWLQVLQEFLTCKVYGDDYDNNVNIPDDDDNIRFVFTHQQFNNVNANDYATACTNIRKTVLGSEFAAITNSYKQKHEAWKIDTARKFSQIMTSADSTALAAILPNFQAAEESLASLSTFVTVVKTYVCMQSIVTVCMVKCKDIETLHEKLMGWISVLAQAFQQRKDFEQTMAIKK